MIPITDTHQHLIDPALGAYSWADGVPQLAGRKFDYSDYLAAIVGTGITQTVFMETTPDNWRAETLHIYGLAAQPGSLIRGVISNCHPENEDFAAQLDRIANPTLVGLRRICHVEPDDFSRSPRFRENMRRLIRLGLTFDLCFFERQMTIALELVRAFPDGQFVLDHCGVPDIAAGQLDPWRGYLRDLAAQPNLACKISGLLAYCKPTAVKLESVRPYVEHSLACFGWDRVVWGSDWPLVTIQSTLRDWVAISREIVQNESESNQHKLFHENARRIYRIR
ncbi:MAG: amidohydrolase [Lacunisphaera sp.]|nr:amidohydrolase [Lacunisphaera sp.]